MYLIFVLVCVNVCWSYNIPHHIHFPDSHHHHHPPNAWTRNPDQKCVLDAEPPEHDSQCCGVDSSSSDYIVGGNATTPEQYPWTVLIEYYDKKNDRFKTPCSGFLISGRYVVSAGHCFVGKDVERTGEPTNIILGEYDTSNEGRDCVTVNEGQEICTEGATRVAIEKVLVHPKHYHNDQQNVYDIALIRMAKVVQFTNFIRPICLPTSDIAANTPKDLTLFAAGWGVVKQETVLEKGKWILKSTYSKVKQHVEVLFRDTKVCRDAWGPFVADHHICAGGDGNDTCRGDSGSPLMYERNGVFEAVGVVSFGARKCGMEIKPSVYTNVFSFVDWLHDNMFKMEADSYYGGD